MKILRYHHNKLDHKGIFFHGLVLSLQTDLKISEVLSLPRQERNYLEGQSGKYLRAPLGMYPLASPLASDELAALGDLSGTVNGEHLIGAGAKVELTGQSAKASAAAVKVHSTSGVVVGYCLLVNWFDDKSDLIASSLGPWITTVDELDENQDFALEVKVNGKPGELLSLQPGDVVTIEAGPLGEIAAELVSA